MRHSRTGGNITGKRQGSRHVALIASLVLWFTMTSVHAQTAVRTNAFRFVAMPVADTDALSDALNSLPRGAQTYFGVPFLVSNAVAATGIEAAREGEFFPSEVRGFGVGATAKRLHLLHGALGEDKDGTPVAKIVFNYADGSSESVRLGYGIHMRNVLVSRYEKVADTYDPNTRLAWSEGDERRGTALRLFHTAIENPKPGVPVNEVALVSLFSLAAPFIVAVSAETGDAGLPPNRPLPNRKPVRDMQELGDSQLRGELTVTVTDAATRAPLSNAVVALSVTDDTRSFYFGDGRTDARGVCALPYPALQAVGIGLWAHAPGKQPALISESRTNGSRLSTLHSLALSPGTTIGGVVKGTNGAGVSGAQVFIYHARQNSSRSYTRVDYDRVETGADGKWTSSSLPADLTGIVLHVSHPEFRPALFATAGYAPGPSSSSSSGSSSSSVSYHRLADGTLVPMTPARRTPAAARGSSLPLLATNALLAGNAELVVQPNFLVEGSLVDAGGQPVPNAEVLMNRNASGGRKRLTTDAHGRFSVRLSDPGPVSFVAMREGASPVAQNLSVGGTTPPVRLAFGATRVLRGVVQDQKQRPVPGAKVRLENWNGVRDLVRFETLSNDDGTFIWTGAPAGTLTFYVSKTNYNNTTTSIAGNTETMTLRIMASPGVFGRVYDAETKKPIESFTIIPGRKYSPNEKHIHWERYQSAPGRNGEYSLRMQQYMFQPEARVLIEAPGYMPQISGAFTNSDSYTNDFALQRAQGPAGVVQAADGSPVAGAALVLADVGQGAYLDEKGMLRANNAAGELVRSDAQGRFKFSPRLEPAKIFAAHEKGCGEITMDEFKKSRRVVLQPWGKIRGWMRVGDRADEAMVRLQNRWPRFWNSEDQPTLLSFYLKAEPGDEGGFVFERVPPGEHRIAIEYRFGDKQYGETPLSHGQLVLVEPDKTAQATLGGSGRKLVGRVKLNGGDHSDVNWRRDVHKLTLVLSNQVILPANINSLPMEERQKIYNAYHEAQQRLANSAEALALERAERTYMLVFATNGTFRADHVPPGTYQLAIHITDPEEEYYNRRFIGSLEKTVVVPDVPVEPNTPLDLGTLEITIRPRVRLGKSVPPFEAKTADGKSVKLADFQGRHVLLHFWGLSMGYSTYDMNVLKELHDTLGGENGKLAILSLNCDEDRKRAETLAKNQNLTWTQVYLGEWSSSPIPAMFGLGGNTGCVLIDPEGKVASQTLRSSTIRTAVNSALSAE